MGLARPRRRHACACTDTTHVGGRNPPRLRLDVGNLFNLPRSVLLGHEELKVSDVIEDDAVVEVPVELLDPGGGELEVPDLGVMIWKVWRMCLGYMGGAGTAEARLGRLGYVFRSRRLLVGDHYHIVARTALEKNKRDAAPDERSQCNAPGRHPACFSQTRGGRPAHGFFSGADDLRSGTTTTLPRTRHLEKTNATPRATHAPRATRRAASPVFLANQLAPRRARRATRGGVVQSFCLGLTMTMLDRKFASRRAAVFAVSPR